jgi:hypothetical protein
MAFSVNALLLPLQAPGLQRFSDCIFSYLNVVFFSEREFNSFVPPPI